MKTIIPFITLTWIGLTGVSAQSREVHADTAHSLMGTYQLWGLALPEKFTWHPEDSTFVYDPKKIDSSYSEAIEKINEFEKRSNACPPDLDSLSKPYNFETNFVRSFYVSKKDFHDIDSLMGIQDSTLKYNGYRLHLAFQPYSVSTLETIHSHLYIGPAHYSKDGTFKDYPVHSKEGGTKHQIYFDLTLPCPNGCASSENQINDINLPDCIDSNSSGTSGSSNSIFHPEN